MVAYAWPGNVRELGAVMDRTAILGDGRKLEVATALGVETPRGPLPPEPVLAANEAAAVPAAPPAPEQILSLDAAMKRHIESALTATQGRIEGPRRGRRAGDRPPHAPCPHAQAGDRLE